LHRGAGRLRRRRRRLARLAVLGAINLINAVVALCGIGGAFGGAVTSCASIGSLRSGPALDGERQCSAGGERSRRNEHDGHIRRRPFGEDAG
jgi:hypothetical protein